VLPREGCYESTVAVEFHNAKVENVFSVPVKVNAGDCVVVVYSRSGNGATDNETQVHALMAP
jgi:hypothetical protein